MFLISQTGYRNTSGPSQSHTFVNNTRNRREGTIIVQVVDKEWRECSGSQCLLKAWSQNEPHFLQGTTDKIDIDRLKADTLKAISIYAPKDRAWWDTFFKRMEDSSAEIGLNIIDE